MNQAISLRIVGAAQTDLLLNLEGSKVCPNGAPTAKYPKQNAKTSAEDVKKPQSDASFLGEIPELVLPASLFR